MKGDCGVLCMIFLLFLTGCKTEHKLEVDVKPLQVTIDVNVKIDRDLDNFFGSLDEKARHFDSAITGEAPTPVR